MTQINASRYGEAFDALVERWRAIENEHDLYHPDRSQCGGVGGCTMMRAAVDREHEMLDALHERRRAAAEAELCTPEHRLDHDHTPSCGVVGPRLPAGRAGVHGC